MSTAISIPESDQRFGKKDRLLKRKDFVALSRSHQKIISAGFVAVYRKNGLNRTRIGITVSKKVGNAVVRNRIKRIVREFVRKRKERISGTWDVNFIARHAVGKWTAQKMHPSLEVILQRLSNE